MQITKINESINLIEEVYPSGKSIAIKVNMDMDERADTNDLIIDLNEEDNNPYWTPSMSAAINYNGDIKSIMEDYQSKHPEKILVGCEWWNNYYDGESKASGYGIYAADEMLIYAINRILKNMSTLNINIKENSNLIFNIIKMPTNIERSR